MPEDIPASRYCVARLYGNSGNYLSHSGAASVARIEGELLTYIEFDFDSEGVYDLA